MIVSTQCSAEMAFQEHATLAGRQHARTCSLHGCMQRACILWLHVYESPDVALWVVPLGALGSIGNGVCIGTVCHWQHDC